MADSAKESIISSSPSLNCQQEAGASNAIYNYVFEQPTAAIMISDFEGNFIGVNSSLCAMFGYKSIVV